MEKQKNLFLHWINIYHSEILTNLPAIEGLQANLAMYTELPVTLNLDSFTNDSILTYGSVAVIPILVISSVQSHKTGFEFYNSLNKFRLWLFLYRLELFVLHYLFLYGS